MGLSHTLESSAGIRTLSRGTAGGLDTLRVPMRQVKKALTRALLRTHSCRNIDLDLNQTSICSTSPHDQPLA